MALVLLTSRNVVATAAATVVAMAITMAMVAPTGAALCDDELTTCNDPLFCCCDPVLFCSCCNPVLEQVCLSDGLCAINDSMTPTPIPSPSRTQTPTQIVSLSATRTPSELPSATRSATLPPSATRSATLPPSLSATRTPSELPSATRSATLLPTPSATLTATATSTATATGSASPSSSSSPTPAVVVVVVNTTVPQQEIRVTNPTVVVGTLTLANNSRLVLAVGDITSGSTAGPPPLRFDNASESSLAIDGTVLNVVLTFHTLPTPIANNDSSSNSTLLNQELLLIEGVGQSLDGVDIVLTVDSDSHKGSDGCKHTLKAAPMVRNGNLYALLNTENTCNGGGDDDTSGKGAYGSSGSSRVAHILPIVAGCVAGACLCLVVPLLVVALYYGAYRQGLCFARQDTAKDRDAVVDHLPQQASAKADRHCHRERSAGLSAVTSSTGDDQVEL